MIYVIGNIIALAFAVIMLMALAVYLVFAFTFALLPSFREWLRFKR